MRENAGMTGDRIGEVAHRVVITGIGVCSPLGGSATEMFRNLMHSETALRNWSDLETEGYRCSIAARIEDVPGNPLRRGGTLALLAARQAVHMSRANLPINTGVYIGSTLGESLAFERAAEGESLDVREYGIPSITDAVRQDFAFSGPAQSLATACAAGNYAVGAAMEDVRSGRVPFAIAGGVEPFSRLSMVGFTRSRAMASDTCRPFDMRRSGMMLGEGAAMFVLETAERAVARDATPLAEVVALGLSCDAYHPTAPRPDGSGMKRAMQAAIDEAGLSPGMIDWVNAHGSGTRASDAAEACALRGLFGNELPIVSGSKGSLGHALGASSALELAVCVQGLLEQTVPPTVGHQTPDTDGVPCTREPVRRPLRWILNNAFAFGGLNSSLLLRRYDS
ncbi:MAG TPA: beta-ketoacyl-[acyl-carrier-protein] synthase family protein [Terriglobales bacterium]|jgi:3-oxoacyl-[acyl-carrier-protein] synthase II